MPRKALTVVEAGKRRRKASSAEEWTKLSRKGGKARWKGVSAARRKAIARAAAAARWGKRKR